MSFEVGLHWVMFFYMRRITVYDYLLSIVRVTASVRANFRSILQEKPIFSFLHTNFYKTPISVCLFYHLFYLKNHFPHFFYYFILNSLSPLTRLSIPTETLLSKTPLHHSRSPIQPSILADPQVPIQASIPVDSQALVCHKRWSTLCVFVGVSMRGCVWFFFFFFFWCGWFFIFVVDLWFCLCGSVYQRKKEDDAGDNALVLQMEKREKKKKSEIRNY